MRNKRKRTASVAAEYGSEVKNIRNIYIPHLHYITWLSAATTIIASWHITDIWSGIVALLCGGISILLINSEMGGLEDESEKA